jgi:ABC-type multidrug transport system ATPase subunit
LCSRIGIVAFGELKCIGSPLHLKNKFADGYKLNINFDPENEAFASKSVEKMFEKLRLVASFKGTKEYRIQIAHGQASEIFAKLESQSANFKIKDWSVSQIGLEDVFHHIVRESHKAAVGGVRISVNNEYRSGSQNL